jgi:hypothetical protein
MGLGDVTIISAKKGEMKAWGSTMVSLTTTLFLVDAFLFVLIGFILIARIKDAKGSLLLAKLSVVMTVFSAAATLALEAIRALIYQNGENGLLVVLLYVPQNMFAMLTLAFLASFSVYATSTFPRRKLVVALFFLVALIPTTYLTLTINDASVTPTGDPEIFNFTQPPLTHTLYALCGIPLGIAPLLLFLRSFVMARMRGDKALSVRAAIMVLALVMNEAAYLFFTFGTGLVETGALVAWTPIAVFLLFAVIKVTSPIPPTTRK